MENRTLFLQQDKEALVDKILQMEEDLSKLRKENETLRQEIERLKTKIQIPIKKWPRQDKPQHKSKPPTQWGRKARHPGCTRPAPAHIDREIEQRLKSCPDCGHRLSRSQEIAEHIQEDIVPSRVEVTRFKRHRYYCKRCKKIVTAPYGPGEVPCGYLGPLALTQIAFLKYYHGLPGNKIKKLFEVFCGLKVSEGAISQALQRLGLYLQVEMDAILEAIKSSAYLHVDETGWKINGANHWLWAFANEKLAFYKIHRSRGSRVPKDILGNPFPEILISDFYSAYNQISAKKQKCLVHLLRELRSCQGPDPPPEYKLPYRKLKRILADAHRLEERRGSLSILVFKRKVRRLKSRLFDFACAPYSNKNWQRLSKRLLKHEQEIFTFLDFPGIPDNNNLAERMIRPHVILRNRWFQNRTDRGANAHSTLTSILHTLLLQRKDPIASPSQAYLAHRQGMKKPVLFGDSVTSIG